MIPTKSGVPDALETAVPEQLRDVKLQIAPEALINPIVLVIVRLVPVVVPTAPVVVPGLIVDPTVQASETIDPATVQTDPTIGRTVAVQETIHRAVAVGSKSVSLAVLVANQTNEWVWRLPFFESADHAHFKPSDLSETLCRPEAKRERHHI
ncbi:hypothetical protein ACFO4N_08025 [Camelliibacillus cellulosilyticus]|uniref:Uncharacterized protein n=2 Tax=Camelliibacillus cellulosilyticus TaxID=2174486 RepID=A0ABV9GKJ5_9BACL